MMNGIRKVLFKCVNGLNVQSCNQKSHYDKHINRKIVCVKQTDKLQELIDKAIEEQLHL